MNADIIFVVRDGEVVEKGSHEELIIKGGKYADLWNKQIFVKPKEPTNGREPDKTTPNGLGTENGQSDGTTDERHEEGSNTSKNGTPVSAKKDTDLKTTNGANGQVVKTPNGHKREVDPSGNQS
jgi:hypothetical protein